MDRRSATWQQNALTVLCGLITAGVVAIISMVLDQGKAIAGLNVHVALIKADVDMLKTRLITRQSAIKPSLGGIQAQAVSDTNPAHASPFEVVRFDVRSPLLHRDKAKQWMRSPPMFGHPVGRGRIAYNLRRTSNFPSLGCAECTPRHTKAKPRAGPNMAWTPSRSSNALAWCGGCRTSPAIPIRV